MKQRYTFVIATLAVIAILGIGSVSAFGFNGFFNKAVTDEDRTAMKEDMDAMQTAIENGDYATWKSLMEAQIAKMQEQITEENFNAIVEQHQEMKEMRTAMEDARTKYCEENTCPVQGDNSQSGGEGFQMHFMKSHQPTPESE